jgi:hypothetical protein
MLPLPTKQPSPTTTPPPPRPPPPHPLLQQAVLHNEFDGLVLPCTGAGTRAGGGLGAWLARSLPDTSNAQRDALRGVLARVAAAEGGRCVYDPAPVVAEFAPFGYGQAVGILVAYLAGLHLLTFAATVATTRRERR